MTRGKGMCLMRAGIWSGILLFGCLGTVCCQVGQTANPIVLPDGKHLSPARNVSAVNSLPATLAVSRDGRYVVSLNNGFGSVESGQRQSISVLDTTTNKVTDFPDDRLGDKARQ